MVVALSEASGRSYPFCNALSFSCMVRLWGRNGEVWAKEIQEMSAKERAVRRFFIDALKLEPNMDNISKTSLWPT